MEQERVEAVVQGLRAWRQAHPGATFDEIDAAVQQQFAPLQAEMVAELSLSQATPAAGGEAGAGEEALPPCCAQCAHPMQAHGTRARRVPTRQGQAVRLRRPYYVCPACGAGRFPPG
jgi:hypothetical protein